MSNLLPKDLDGALAYVLRTEEFDPEIAPDAPLGLINGKGRARFPSAAATEATSRAGHQPTAERPEVVQELRWRTPEQARHERAALARQKWDQRRKDRDARALAEEQRRQALEAAQKNAAEQAEAARKAAIRAKWEQRRQQRAAHALAQRQAEESRLLTLAEEQKAVAALAAERKALRIEEIHFNRALRQAMHPEKTKFPAAKDDPNHRTRHFRRIIDAAFEMTDRAGAEKFLQDGWVDYYKFDLTLKPHQADRIMAAWDKLPQHPLHPLHPVIQDEDVCDLLSPPLGSTTDRRGPLVSAAILIMQRMGMGLTSPATAIPTPPDVPQVYGPARDDRGLFRSVIGRTGYYR